MVSPPDQGIVSTLIDFGFPREPATLACALAHNDLETAVEILAECDSDLQALNLRVAQQIGSRSDI